MEYHQWFRKALAIWIPIPFPASLEPDGMDELGFTFSIVNFKLLLKFLFLLLNYLLTNQSEECIYLPNVWNDMPRSYYPDKCSCRLLIIRAQWHIRPKWWAVEALKLGCHWDWILVCVYLYPLFTTLGTRRRDHGRSDIRVTGDEQDGWLAGLCVPLCRESFHFPC